MAYTWATLSPYLISEGSGWESEKGIGKVLTGRMVFAIPVGSIETLREHFEPGLDHYWPGLASGSSGDPCAIEYDLDYEFPGRPGFARVVVYYAKPKIIDQLSTNKSAVLYVEVMGTSQRIRKVGDTIVEGPASPASGDNPIEYRVVKGTNTVPVPDGCTVRLRTAYTTPPFATAYGLIGKYNAAETAFSTFLTVTVKKLLYLGMRTQGDVNSHGLWIVDHYWRGSATAWDVQCYTEKHERIAVRVKVQQVASGGGYEDTSSPIRYATIYADVPMGSASAVDVTRGSGDFTTLLSGITYLNRG